MKTLALALLVLSAPLAHAAPDENQILLQVNCNVADFGHLENPNIITTNLTLKVRDNQLLTAYQGHKYLVFTSDITQGSDPAPRRELGIVVRDEKTDAVINSAISVFSLDSPAVLLQNGPNKLVRCSAN